MNSTPLRLFIIRHGETKWSQTGRHTGGSDIPLTKRGEQEAREIGVRLRTVEFSKIFTSPLQRAKRTCELAEPDKAVTTDSDLSEWNYGDYEGKKSSDIRKDCPNWDLFRDGCPAGESPRQVAARADRIIVRLRLRVGNYALFTHGQFGAVLAMRWIGLPIADAEHFPLGTGSVSILAYASRHSDVPVVTRWNEPSRRSYDIGVYPREEIDNACEPQAIERWETDKSEITGVGTAATPMY